MKKAPREWSKYVYFEPKSVLVRLQEVRKQVASSNLPKRVKNLRAKSLQREREAWDTAVFCYLLSQALNLDIRFCREEKSDYDSIFTWKTSEAQHFAPVQMKELVPKELNPFVSLNGILSSLCKYVNSPDLVVGIKLNREICLDFKAIDTKILPVAEVWMFGSTSKDESVWSLFGQSNNDWKQYELELPNA